MTRASDSGHGDSEDFISDGGGILVYWDLRNSGEEGDGNKHPSMIVASVWYVIGSVNNTTRKSMFTGHVSWQFMAADLIDLISDPNVQQTSSAHNLESTSTSLFCNTSASSIAARLRATSPN